MIEVVVFPYINRNEVYVRW